MLCFVKRPHNEAIHREEKLHDWSEDAHDDVEAPFATMIPARMLHNAVAQKIRNRMADIIAPLRFDVSRQKGWVKNADEQII